MNPVKPHDIRILVVDDNPDILAGNARLLEHAGYVVDRAADGETALQAAKQHRPDLILLDRNLPGIDGLEVCRRIKHDPDLSDMLVVIASSSAVGTADQSEGLEYGADGYISCPIANREMLARVEAFVRIVRLTRNLREKETEAKEAAASANQSSAAALNLMEDAIEAQKRLEAINQKLLAEIAERTRAEASLVLNTAALTAAGNAIIITNRDSVIVWVNPAFTHLTGYPFAAAVGRKPNALIKSGEHPRSFYEQMWKTILAGQVWRGELVNRRQDGTRYPEEMTITPVHVANGEITHFIAIKQDLTERKRAEEALERTNRALRVVSSGNEALVHADEEAKLLQKVCRIAVDVGGYRMAWVGFAQSDETKTVRPVASAGTEDGYLTNAKISWADNEYGGGPTGLAIRTGRPCICQNLGADPRMAPWRDAACARGYQASIALPLLQGGHAFGALTIYAQEAEAFNPSEANLLGDLCEDLSYGIAALRARREREETAAALRASEERYRLLFEDNPLPMWLYDDETLTFISVNGTAVRNYGYTRDEFLQMSIKRIVPDEDLAELLRSLDVNQANGSGSRERRHRRKDGSIIHVEEISRPLVFNDRAVHLVLAADVTEKKLLEEKFLHAQRLESIGMLAAGVAHDLNNVLAPIVFAAPMLRENLIAPRDLKILDTLEQCAERGAGLVKQILGFVRTTSSELRPTQVKYIARDIVSLIEETFPKAIEFEHQVPSNLWAVEGNATQIHQVLMNLCVNARDAMPEGGTLRLILANRQLDEREAAAIPGARPGTWLMLEVGDTGTGIPPGVLEHIWTPFFTTKGIDRGTGLGLTTVRSIVLSHHGFIEVQTEEGKGTTFRVFLPVIETKSHRIGDGAGVRVPEGRGELILVVEDDTAIRNLVAAILEEHGYRTLACADGVDGVDQFTSQPDAVSLIITDVDMPRLGGLGLAQTVRRTHPGIPIVAMSGMSHSASGVSDLPSIRSLADAILHKPFTNDELLGAVCRVLQATQTS